MILLISYSSFAQTYRYQYSHDTLGNRTMANNAILDTHLVSLTGMNIIRLIISSLILILISSCIDNDPSYYLTIHNKSDEYVIYGSYYQYPHDSVSVHLQRIIKPHYVFVSTVGPRYGKKDSWTSYFVADGYEYVSVFIFEWCPIVLDNNTLYIKNYTVYDDYHLLCRYDFTLEDLESLNWNVYYPPTEEMKNIHMWPPYSEVVNY